MTDENTIDQDVDLHDDDEEIMEMKHGKKKMSEMDDHEADSVKSADAASDASGSAPKRTGDQSTQDPMPKTKAALMAAMMHNMGKMDKKSLQAMYGKHSEMMHHNESVDEDGEMIDEAPRAEVTYEANFEDDLNALVSEEATLSDEFKDKASTIFEAAIKSKLSEEIDRLEAKYNEELAEEVSTTKAELVEKVDSYLNYVVEQWMEDNKVAVQAGLRTEIAEKFMGSLKDLFVESYIEVPESKVDLVDELAGEVEELEGSLNASTGKIIEMTEELESFKRDAVIREATKDLADTQVEKLKSLVADIDFGDNFAEMVATVKESYFKNEAAGSEVDADQICNSFFLGHWGHGHHGVTVLTATTGLLLKQTANILGGSSDGLAVSHAWLANGHVHFHVANQLVFNDFQVQFTHSADDGFACFIVVITAE